MLPLVCEVCQVALNNSRPHFVFVTIDPAMGHTGTAGGCLRNVLKPVAQSSVNAGLGGTLASLFREFCKLELLRPERAARGIARAGLPLNRGK